MLSTLLIFTYTTMNAQKVVKLWETNPPTNNEITETEKCERNGNWITNVSSPELTIYQANKATNTGMAVVICPGGGYAGLAIQHEGSEFAKWLNGQGITAFVLKYRMPNKHKEVPLDDAQQAMRYVRKHANEFGIDANKVGIAGFSAGGHLAATTSTHYTTEGTSTKPDFSILFIQSLQWKWLHMVVPVLIYWVTNRYLKTFSFFLMRNRSMRIPHLQSCY